MITTLTQLQDALDTDMAWRVREVAYFQNASRTLKGPAAQTYIRAGIALVYAHWEGFVKVSSEAYIEFVQGQGHSYKELKACFSVLGLKERLSLLAESKQLKTNVAIVEFLIDGLHKRAEMGLGNAVKTESNLSSSVFSNIATSINIDASKYATKSNLIDIELLKRRNKIAHGEFLDIKHGEFLRLSNAVLELMRNYKTDIENAASQKDYIRR